MTLSAATTSRPTTTTFSFTPLSTTALYVQVSS